jgi:hypothetical protein
MHQDYPKHRLQPEVAEMIDAKTALPQQPKTS